MTPPTSATVAQRVRIGFSRDALPLLAVRRLRQMIRNYRSLKRDFEAMRQQYCHSASLNDQVDIVCTHKVFGAIQQPREIVTLLRLLEQNPPRYVCEIGAASGGTLFLLARVCRPDAVLLNVDLDLNFERSLVHARFATRKQRIISISGDSRASQTIARVRSALHGEPLDFLFIDGDHAYDAVKADFTNYRPLVRPGGLIAFHDIVEDFNTRYGTPTGHHTGGVPIFWQELKTQYRTSEFIEDPAQDGYGIGVIHN